MHLPHRRALLLNELAIVLCGLSALGLIVAGVVHERRAAQRVEHTSAALETAQNILTLVRRGADPQLPTGWSLARSRVSSAVVVVTVQGDGVTLATLLASADASGGAR